MKLSQQNEIFFMRTTLVDDVIRHVFHKANYPSILDVKIGRLDRSYHFLLIFSLQPSKQNSLPGATDLLTSFPNVPLPIDPQKRQGFFFFFFF